MNSHRTRRRIASLLAVPLALALAVACGTPAAQPEAPASTTSGTAAYPLPPVSPSAHLLSPQSPLPTESPLESSLPTPSRTDTGASGLTGEEAATLRSLTQVDEFPLYTMQYHGKYQTALPTQGTGERVAAGGGPRTWACSLFAALAAGSDRLYGRNFDWQFSPALLLFTDPPDGYASVSMVDLAYLFEADLVRELVDLPLADRKPLLDAPFWPFDGMNEHGLTVGMAAVPSTPAPSDKDKPTIDSLAIIREMLDHAQDVDEAVEILASYSILWGGGPTLHYLVADRAGKAALVEFYQGEMVVLPNENAWHLATNFLRRQADESGMHDCWRYDQMGERLTESQGQLTPQRALDLLAQVAQPSTQWSMVYNMTTGEIAAVMGRDWEDVEAFRLGIAGH